MGLSSCQIAGLQVKSIVMRILITGANGQLGRALQQALVEHQLVPLGHAELDVSDRAAVFAAVAAAQPELIIHSAAYTDVDGCARNPALAYRVNGLGTQNVALACQTWDIPMLHVSSNEVFSGDHPAGYEEWMPLSPRNAYGRSKAAAEFHVCTLLPRHYIVRTSWLYSPGGRNFIHAILKRARETGQLRVVTDEIASPTYTGDLAEAIAQLITTRQYGTYHFTNSGVCSRWEFANGIVQQAGLANVVNTPILSSEFQRPSSPPPFGILHNIAGAALGITLRPWAEALADCLRQLR